MSTHFLTIFSKSNFPTPAVFPQ